MYLQELGQAITGQNLDAVGFDTLSEAMLEVAYRLAGRHMVASEGVSPVTGWDLESLLSTFASSGLGALDFLDSIVTNALYSMIMSSTIQNTVRQAVLRSPANAGAALPTSRVTTTPREIKDVDLSDMTNVVESTLGCAGVQAEALKSAVQTAVVAEWHNSNGHPNSHGLAVHYIPVQTDGTPGSLDPSYFRGALTQYL